MFGIGGEWSFAQLRIKDSKPSKAVSAFSSNDSIIGMNKLKYF